MSELDNVIQFTIELQNKGIAREGFGLAMIASHNANDATAHPDFHERFRLYNDISGVTGDGFPADGPEALAAKALFNQQPHPRQIAIGRMESAVTQKYVIGVANVRNSFAYKVLVEGEGVTTTTVVSTSDSSATNDEIAADLVTQLNAVTGKNYTAAATGTTGSHVVTVTGDAASNWFSLKVLDVSALSNAQTHVAPSGTTIANDLDAILHENNSFYRVVTLYNSRLYVDDAWDWVESNEKTYVVDTCDSATITTAESGGDDVGTDYLGEGNVRTDLKYHPRPAAMLSAAVDGRLLPLDVGTWTEAFKTLVGPETVGLTPTQRQNLIDRRMGSYELFAGRGSTFEGKVASEVYGYLDIVVAVDWFKNECQSRVAGLLLSRDKIGFTDEDIADVAGEIRGAIALAVSDQHKVLAHGVKGSTDDPPPDVSFPRVADIDPSTRALRTLPNGTITGRFQGAVQTVQFIATLSF